MYLIQAAPPKLRGRIHPSRTAPNRQNCGTIGFTPLVEGLTIELHQTAVLSAVVTSAVNTLFGPGQPADPKHIFTYALADLTLLRSLKSMVADTLPGGTRQPALLALLQSLSDSQDAFVWYADEIETLGQDRASIVHRRSLTEAWKRTCRLTIEALNELEHLLDDQLPEPYLQNHKVLFGLLNSAAQGFKPCIDSNGGLFLPPLPQQRRWPRLSVLQKCTVAFRGISSPAFIRDASAGGLGLDKMPAVECGTHLTVEMETGRSLQGTVVWTRNTSAGVQFLKPLLPSDPLLRG